MEKQKIGLVTIVVMIAGVLIFASSSNADKRNTSNNNLGTKYAVSENQLNNYSFTSKNVYVKYRGYVDIGASYFEYLNTSRSSFVRGAWYDKTNSYMVISLNGIYYHYCGMPKIEWSSFKMASSFGSYYITNIKGNYDCRIYPVPKY